MPNKLFIIILFVLLPVLNTYGQADTIPSDEPPEAQLYRKYKKDEIKSSATGFRRFISKFSFGYSLGYGVDIYKNPLDGYTVNSGSSIGPYIYSNNPEDTVGNIGTWMTTPDFTATGGTESVSSDTADLKYRGVGSAIPMSLTIHYNWKRLRLGLGADLGLHFYPKMRPKFSDDDIWIYESDKKSSFYKRFYISGEYAFKEFLDYTWAASLRVGILNRGKIIDKSYAKGKFFVNVGFNIERNLSEYFKVILRPQIDFKSYKMAINGNDVRVNQHGLYTTIGISYRIPELKKSPMKADHVQVNHILNGVEYRSNRHPFHKYQNPNYGQNHRKPTRLKGKNKKRLQKN
ncbi:hypothetical protein [Marinigracilibium pacificum]|uniref:Uncharacterized protein n=1 Tax=Marinigracilibium pacificum TaxID=2729599 RepID=A0A848J2D2_9BACT|nr:hypothetical protein [Marinigracilibium pacificum]NMM49881.1 hypothetical protein [Marinigracilibium pacificum]